MEIEYRITLLPDSNSGPILASPYRSVKLKQAWGNRSTMAQLKPNLTRYVAVKWSIDGLGFYHLLEFYDVRHLKAFDDGLPVVLVDV